VNVARPKNVLHTPAIVLELSLAGFVACPVEPEDLRAALDTACPHCGRLPVRVRAYERGERYRILLSCGGCGWAAEA
jgi:hypothetical protein